MKRLLLFGVIVLAVGLPAPQNVPAQGRTYQSNLGQASTGSLAVGSDSWMAALFETGTNSDGYVLNSIQLAMTDASGTPNGFTVMLYGEWSDPNGLQPGTSIASLSGSLNPVTSGIYTYTAAPNLTLSPTTYYWIVLTAGTPVANGAYGWSVTSTFSPTVSDGWGTVPPRVHWGDGSSWHFLPSAYPQFAINATAVPEPSTLGLFALGGLLFVWRRWKAKAV